MLNHDTNTVITVPTDSAQLETESLPNPLLIQGGIAVTVIMSIVLLIKALTGLIEASKD